MPYSHTLGGQVWHFADLATLMARATPLRSGDVLAGVAARTMTERMAARMALAELPLKVFLSEALVPYEVDEVTRLIVDSHDAAAFAEIAHLTVGDFRDWLLLDATDEAMLARVRRGITPEMAAAVSKLMRNQDLIRVARKCRVIGINPAGDGLDALGDLMRLTDEVIQRFGIPTQSCVLTHVTNQIRAIEQGAPVDLVFQSIAGTEAANRSFGIDLAVLREAREAALSLGRGTLGDNVMYFETGQGSALSAGAHHGLDQQTCEVRAYAVARAFEPMICNTVVGFIGPEYLFDGKQIVRAGLEDHFCGKLLGLPIGCDVCYTNHAEADSDDMDNLMLLLGAAGVTFLIGVPGADDVMLNYQSTSFHDALVLREVLGLKRAPEFAAWLQRMGLADTEGRLLPSPARHALLEHFA
ncbi:MAG: ethanolamine ammonia-lyase subunit EutB [Sphaerotilus sulfidivorans]|uniref:ethanolamine ammonia-lyase subunit EutB n=1 Tax=Sphaerotilus sulfidivorans TaxID=639200 RepID=UPI003F2E4E8E